MQEQDSLDDYVKFIKPELPPREIRTEFQIVAQRKQECETRALKIVEFSIEGKLRPEIFTRCLPYINQSHYQDIVEERAITKLCGYSVCGKIIPEMPKKQFYISTKSNKIYDITDRKNYCSNLCYKASIHIKKQIDDSPLWLRKLDAIPEYQLLGNDGGGVPGEPILQGISKPGAESVFTSVNSFAHVSLTDMINKEKEQNREQKSDKRKGNKKKTSKLVKTMQTITEMEQTEEEEDQVARPKLSGYNPLQKSSSLPVVVRPKPEPSGYHPLQKSSSLSVIIENEENIETKSEFCEKSNTITGTSIKLKSIPKKIKKKTTKYSKVDVEDQIKKVVKEWLTLESLIFLYGESKIKEILNEKKLSDCFEKLNIDKMQRGQQIKYMDICRRLHLQEMADDKFDSTLIGTQLKPLPDYAKIKQENKELNIKVKCFYGGVMREKEDSNFPMKINKPTDNEDSEDVPFVLPLVDANSQKALRRNIFLGAVNKSMQQLLQGLRIKFYNTILSDLQTLVKTFNLNADNIVFRPAIWNYISIVLLNILSVRDPNINKVLEEKSSQEYVMLQLSILPNKEVIVSDIMKDISNVDMFIENHISSN